MIQCLGWIEILFLNSTKSPHQPLDSDKSSVSRVDYLTSAKTLLASFNDAEAWIVLERNLA